MQLGIGILVGLVLAVAGFAMGKSSGRASALDQGRKSGLDEGRRSGLDEGRKAGLEQARGDAERGMRSLIEAVKRGRRPEGAPAGSVAAELQGALEQGWAPRETEREAALREAIGRVSSFLDTRVRAPLGARGSSEGAEQLRERIERALGALEDLDFFISEASEVRTGSNLVPLVQRVSKEFAGDHAIGVRLMLGSSVISAEVGPSALMDALYLILHNAGRFGGGSTVDLKVEQVDGHARIVVRDHGKGFSEEAFARAFDPFYSTSDEGLGLGLPHARKIVEEMGGRIELRNVPDGGAEVEISFPSN